MVDLVNLGARLVITTALITNMIGTLEEYSLGVWRRALDQVELVLCR